jgi:hypothetical protein
MEDVFIYLSFGFVFGKVLVCTPGCPLTSNHERVMLQPQPKQSNWGLLAHGVVIYIPSP